MSDLFQIFLPIFRFFSTISTDTPIFDTPISFLSLLKPHHDEKTRQLHIRVTKKQNLRSSAEKWGKILYEYLIKQEGCINAHVIGTYYIVLVFNSFWW